MLLTVHTTNDSLPEERDGSPLTPGPIDLRLAENYISTTPDLELSLSENPTYSDPFPMLIALFDPCNCE